MRNEQAIGLKKIVLTAIFIAVFVCLAVFSITALSPAVLSDDGAYAYDANLRKSGTNITVSSVANAGVSALPNETASSGLSASHFWLYTDENVSSSDFKWMNENAWGFQDYSTDSDRAFVYYLQIAFSGDMLTAVRQGRVSMYFYCEHRFDDGVNDESGCAIQWLNQNAPTNLSVSSSRNWSDASWTDTFIDHCVEAYSWSNDDGNRTNSYGVQSYSSSYAVSASATGVRLVFGAISDSALDGGFKNIRLKFYFNNYGTTIASNNTSYGTVDKSSWSTNSSGASTTVTATPKDGCYLQNWTATGYTTNPGHSNQPAGETITVASSNLTQGASVTANILTANFAQITYTVVYNANYPAGVSSGADCPSNQTVYGTGSTAALGSATLASYRFVGWMLSSSSAKPDYYSTGSFAPYTKNTGKASALTVNLYALWQAANVSENDSTFEITSTSPASYALYEDLTFTISASKTGHSLVGIYAEYTSGPLNGQTIALQGSGSSWTLYGICGNCTLSAKWVANRYSITFSANGGSGSISTQYYYYGTSHALPLTSYTRSGHSLTGYSLTGGNASGTVFEVSSSTYGNLTATAQWASNSHSTIRATEYHSSDEVDWTDYYNSTSITVPAVYQKARSAGATIKVTVSGTVYSYCDNSWNLLGGNGAQNDARFQISNNNSSWTSSDGWVRAEVNVPRAGSPNTNSNTASKSISDYTVTGNTLYVRINGQKKKRTDRGNSNFASEFQSWTATFSISGTPVQTTYTYNGNGGLTLASESSVTSSGWGSATDVSSSIYFFKKPGYYQSGWSSRTATYTINKYPIITYDVFTGDTGTCSTIRNEWYAEYGATVNLNPTNTSNTSYSGTSMYPKAGGNPNDYRGFTPGTAYQITARGTNPHSNTWHTAFPSTTHSASLTSLTSISGATWAYYEWTMDAGTGAKVDSTVLYGNSIDLESLVTASHGDPNAISSIGYWQINSTDKTFYHTGVPVIYAVAESGQYFYKVYTTTTRSSSTTGATVTITKLSGYSSSANSPTATITPVKLVLNAPTGGAASLTYNGTVQEFAFTTTVDSTQYSGDVLTMARSKFANERNIEGGTGLPWYYDASGNNSGYWCGVAIDLLGLGYSSSIGSSYYTQGSTTFCDAGTYWVNTIIIKQYLISVQAFSNTNYQWTSTASQTISANENGLNGTVSATISPKTTGVNLYAFYTYKMFGEYADPAIVVVNMDDAGYSFASCAQTSWYFGISGLLAVDYELYAEDLKSGLARAKEGLYNQAGTYAVTMSLNSTIFPTRLLNNYGCTVSSADYTALTTSTICLYFYNSSGTKMSNTGYSFLSSTSWSAYTTAGHAHNNFEIKPREVTMTYSGSTSFTYNNTPQGPTEVVSTGLLDQSGQNIFKFLPVDSPVGNPQALGYYELVNSEYVETTDTSVLSKTYYSRSTSYDNYFQLYFYGIPMPAGWSGMNSSAKSTYISENIGSKVIVGSGNRIYVDGISNDWIQFLETNAGSYGVILVGTAYSSDGGTTFYTNPDYVLGANYSFSWTISKVTLTATSSTTSPTFGDTNFGGTGFVFSGFETGDAITCTVTTTRNSGSSTGFIRYQGLTSSTEVTNGTYRNYGTHVGTYVTSITNPQTVGSTSSSGLYGASYGNNYQFSSATLTSTLEIVFRTVTKTVTYTIDSGSTYSNSKPNGTYDWVYEYGVSKGVKIVLSGFYTDGFATNDISYYGGGKSAAELAKILIPSVTTTIPGRGEVEGLLDPAKITISKTKSSSPAPTETAVPSITGTGSVTYTFFGINAHSSPYTVAFSAVTAMNYTYNSTNYNNYHINAAINESFTISPKTITLSWKRYDQVLSPVNLNIGTYYELSAGVFTLTNDLTVNGSKTYYTATSISSYNPSITYDATPHTMVASLSRAANGTITANDNLVYYGDYVSATTLYTIYSASGSTALSYSGDITKTNAGSYSAYADQLTGNYRISEAASSYTALQLDWTIARRTFTMSVTSPGLSYLYDGTQKTISLNLNSSGVTVNIDNFTTNVSGVAGAHFSMTGVSFNAADKTFGATNVGRYEFSYDAGSGIDVETNWRLTGSATYTSSTTYLFVICPKVLSFAWNNTSLDYNGTNRVADFNPSYNDGLAHTGLTLTYSITDITHAGNYTQVVTGASGNSNFVLGSASLSSQWYATYNTNERLSYYTEDCVANGSALSTYSQAVTLNPYTITLNTSALNAELTNFVYDGSSHGHTLASLYTSSVQSSLLTAADRSGYSLAGTSATGTNAGNYRVTITGFNAYAGHTDYVLAATYDNTWSITPRPLTFVYTEYHEFYEVASPTGNPHNLGYHEKSYVLTDDVIDYTGKTYYSYSAGVYSVVADPSGNPHDLGYYEAQYTLSSDTSVNGGKTYYTKGSFAGNPPSIAYDGLQHGFYLSISNMVEGEKITLNFSHTNTNLGERTSFKLSASGASILYGVDALSYTFTISSISNATVGGNTYLAANYSIPLSGTDKTWSIEQRTIVVTWHNTSLTYRASEYNTGNGGCYATVTNLVGSDTFTLTYGGTSAATNAGVNYPISISAITGGDSDNYQIVGSLSTTWTIAQKTVSLVSWAGNGFAGLSVTYDGAAHNVVATPTSGASADNDGKVYSGDAATFAFSYSSTSPYVTNATVVGTYQSHITGCKNANYTVSAGGSATTTWYITQRTITAVVSYDSAFYTAVASPVLGDIGSYYELSAGVYSLTEDTVIDGEKTYYTFNPVVYDHASHGLTVTLSGFVATDYSSNLSFTFTFTTTDNTAGALTSSTVYARTFKAVAQGSYSVSVALNGGSSRASCYTLGGTTSGAFTVNACPVTLSWALSGVGGFSAVYDGVAHVLSATVDNLADEDDVVNVVVSNGTETNVGSYTGSAASLSNSNYTLTGGTNLTRTFSITARPITASWSSDSYTYNGGYQSNTLTLYNLIAGDSLTFTVNFYTGGYSGTNIHTSTVTKTGSATATLSASDLAATIDVGTYYAILSTVIKTGGVTNPNYSFTPTNESDRCTYEIGCKTLTLSGTWTWTNGLSSGTYTNETHLIYNTAAYVLTTTIAGGVTCTRADTSATDVLTLTYSGNSTTHASASETATVSGITGTYASNYVLPASRSRSYAVYAKEVTIVWSNYSGIVYDGNNHTITADIASSASTGTDGKAYTDDTVTVTTISNATQRNADAYTSVASALSNSDYAIGTGSYAPGNATLNWSISARPVSLTWSAVNIQYDGTEKTVTATISNLIAGDVVTMTYSNNAKTVVDDYTASVTALGGANASNYTLTSGVNLSHTWHITPIVLSFSWSGGANLVYNKSAQGVLLTIDNIASADIDDTDKLTFTTAGGVTATHDESVYTITFTGINANDYTASVTAITGSSAANYALPGNTSTDFSIAQRVVTVSWTSSDVTYDSASHNAVASVTNLCVGDSTTLTYRTLGAGTSYNVLGAAGTGNVATHADTYTTSITAVSNANYTISGATGLSRDWTISAKPLTAFTFLFNGSAPATITYDGTAKAVTATVAGAATATDDGKTYTGDSVTLGYSGSVLTNYGISAISGNSATNAGVYRVYVSSTNNSDYSVAGIYLDVTIAKRTLTVSIGDITSSSYVYSGTAQGKRVTLGNIVAGDNDNTNLNIIPAVYTAVANPVVGDIASYYEISAYALTGDVAINASKRYYTESSGVYTYVSSPVVGDIGSYYEPSAYTLTEDVALNGSKTYFTLLSLSDTTRGETTLYRDSTALNAGSYNGVATLSGSRYYNYQLASVAGIHFTITPKSINTAIVANTTTDTFTYAARAIAPADLGISFSTLITGEALTEGTDYSVSYKQSGSPIAAPSAVGSYSAVISLAGTTSANNYTLVGTTEFYFDIVPYIVTPAMITWKVGGTTVSLNGMVFSNTNKTVTATITDAVFTVNSKTISYRYFGFCNGALNQTQAEFAADSDHTDHQWLLDNGNFRTTGPIHAGTYWVVLTLSGGDSTNFRFSGFTGYADANHFTTSAGNTYLTYYNDPTHYAISSALPVLGDNVACMTFGINRAELGAEVVATPSTLPYSGSYYLPGAHVLTEDVAINALKTYYEGTFTVVTSADSDFLSTYYEYIDGDYVLTEDAVIDGGKTYYTGSFSVVGTPVVGDIRTYYEYYGLPYISAKASGAEILVEIDSTLYSYATYQSSNVIRDAGTYTIRIYDANASGAGSITGCDFFTDGAVFESVTELTVSKSKITVTDARTDEYAWTKTYDKTTPFTSFTYPTGVTFTHNALTNGVISGTTATVTANYSDYNAAAGTYVLTGDVAINGSKYYYTKMFVEVVSPVVGNIASYYEYSAGNYVLTEDVAIDGGKTYYSLYYNPVETPVVGELGTYYEYIAGARALTFSISGADANNYYLVFTSSENFVADNDITKVGNSYTFDGRIDQRIITVTGNASKVYDGTTALVPFEITSSQIISGDSVTVTGTFESANVGTWDITISTGNPNYRIGTSIAARGTISAKPVTFNYVNCGTVTYDKTAHGVTVTVVGMVGGHEEAITVTGGGGIANTTIAAGTSSATYTAVNAGTYSISLTLAAGGSSNYSISSATTFAKWTISQKTVVISWTKDTLADGAYIYDWSTYSVVYSAVERSVTPSVSGIITGDTVGFTSQYTAATNVGNYTAEVTALTGSGDEANYVLPVSTTQAWSITSATITGVTFSSIERVYNAAAQGPEVNTYLTQHGISLNAVYSGGVNKTRDTLVGNNARTAVGTSSVSVTLSAANYTNLVLNASVSVTQATVTGVTLSNVNVTYDTTAKSVTVNRTTTQFDETVTVTYQISDDNETFVSGNSKTNAGTYYVRASCTAGGNYADFVLNATLVIAKADITQSRITVTDDSGTITYDAAFHGVVITVEDNETQYGEAVTITYYGGESGGQAKNVGTYHINAVVSAGSNYNDFTTDSTTLTIQAKSLTLSYQVATFTYNGNVQTPTVTISSGVCAADVGTVALSVGVLGTSGEANGDTIFLDAGTYRVTPTVNNSNYTIPAGANSSYKDYTVNQATITGYYFVGNTVSYNGAVRYLGVYSDNVAYMNNVTTVALLASDEGTVTYKYNTTSLESAYNDTFTGAKYAGTYYVQATISAGGNYSAWSRTATLVINSVSLVGYSLDDIVTTYDGSVKTLAVTVADGSLYVAGVYYTSQGDALTLTYTISSDAGVSYSAGNSATNVLIINSAVAAYRVRLTFTLAAEATDSYVAGSLVLNATLTINKANLSGISFPGGTFVYDGNTHNVIPSVTPAGEGYPRYSLNGAKTVLTVILSASHNSGSGDTFTVTQSVDEGVNAVNVGSYNFRLGITPLSATASNYVAFAGLVSTVTITAATMSTNAGAALVQNTNIYFGTGELEFSYDAVYHYLILSSSSASSVLTTNAGSLVSSFTVYPSTNTAHSDVAEVVYSVNGAAESGVKNVGVYTVTATLQNGNYVSVPLTATVTVDRANIPYYFVGKTDLVYDTLTHYVALNASNAYLNDGTVTQIDLQGSDKATVAYTYTSVRNGSGTFSGATNADTYSITATITVSGGAGGNYNTWETNNAKTVSLIIASYSTPITWVNHDASFTYNGSSFAGIITASFVAANGSNTAMTISYLGTSGKATGDTDMLNAGTYTVTATYASATAYNYTFTTTTTQTVTVNKANVTLYLVNASTTYNGTVRYLAVNTVNASNVTTSNVTSVNPFASDIIPVSYTYAKAGGTYDSYYDGENTVTLTVGARNAGTYTVTANISLGEGEVNYNAWASPLSATFTIDKVILTQTGGTFTKEYDGSTTIADFGTIGGIISADSAHLTQNGVYNNKNVGTGKPIVFSIVADEHYEYLPNNYILPTSVTGTITARALSITTTLLYWTKPYDGTTSSAMNPLSITTSNRLISGDSITVNAVYNSKNVLSANAVSFTILGADSANYSLAAIDFSASVDFENTYLITPLSVGIIWSTDESDYNGTVQAVTATVDVYGEDAEGNSGTISLPITLRRTHDGNGTALAPAQNNATYRNAGTYEATASTEGEDEDFVANYGISSTVHTYVIHKASRGVNWSGLAATYTYNGTDQGTGIVATVTLLGTDVTTYAETDYLTVSVTKNSVAASFQNAGDYTLTASLTVAELTNNYTLSNHIYDRTIYKANITNIVFTGSYSWTYYSGVTDYFFVVAAGGTYARYESGAFSLTTSYNYPYDAVAMPIEYGGGEYSHANVSGNNGVKNAGSYIISASVAESANYNSWGGSISVTVSKGTIDNIVMGDLAGIYDSNNHYLFAYNGTVNDGSTGKSEFETVYTPDGVEVTVTYGIAINDYYYEDYSAAYSYSDRNYAVNAGVYAVGGFILDHRNYVDYTVPNVVSSLGTGAILDIAQRDAAITWEYNNQAVADFTYDATNQAAKIRARIIRIEGGAHNYYLSVAFALDEDVDVAEALQTVFVVAGDYDLTASVPNTTAEEIAEYSLICNNYNITGTEVSVEMKKFTVAIQWRYMTNHSGGDPEVYDVENPCVYDATTHGVTATGLGLNSVVMTIDTSGTFSAINAGSYTASVDAIHEGTDSLVLNANTYYLSYDMNYQLADATLNWSIARRPVTLTLDTEHSNLSKIYDGNRSFTYTNSSISSTNELDGTVTITWTYHTTNEKVAQNVSTIIYSINNIIASDSAGITLPISDISASTENVTADSATIVFNEPELNSNYIVISNLSAIIIMNDDLITPRDIELVFDEDTSHVYNGETFSLTYTYGSGINAGIDGLFGLSVSALIGSNCIVGSANIGGEIDAGTYDITASFTTKDVNNVTNYSLTVPAATYSILQRRLEISYTNLLQSLQQSFSHIVPSVVAADSDLDDLDWEGMGETLTTNLTTLLTADGFSVTVGTAWESGTYTQYTQIAGSADSLVLPVTISSSNYVINYPILQITYLKVASSYSFLVENLNDFLHLDTDNYGLLQTYDTYGIGSLPTFTQTANISGLVDGGYTVMPSIRSFRGNYVGGNYSISHLIVLPNSASEEQERYYVGLFNRIIEGSVRNWNLYDISVYSSGSTSAVGAFSGEIAEEVTVQNIVMNFSLSATASYAGTITVGGFVGSLHGTMTSITVVGDAKLKVNSYTELYYGGVIGYAYDGSANTVTSFVDSSIVSTVSIASDFYYGSVVGGKETDWEDALTTYSYLASSLYTYDGDAETATLWNSAFGDEIDTTHSANYDTLHGISAVGTLLDTYVIRSYLFATGCTGLSGSPVVITNFRQMYLLVAYPYLSFRVANDVYTPIPPATYHRGFYGTITYTGGAEFVADLPSDTRLMDAVKDSWIVIKKEEE